jgi:hypothetical protein
MIGRTALLSCSLFLAAAGSAQAQKPALPIGDWTDSAISAKVCQRPELTIKKDRLIQRIDQEGIRGEARCKILKIKKQTKGDIFIYTKCDWDKHVPQGMRESPDNESDDSFSLKIVDHKEILFNNISYRLCPAKQEGAR